MVEIFTDGSWRASESIGGYGVVALEFHDSGPPHLLYAFQKQEEDTTNNRMELKAILHACDYADKNFPDEEVIIWSDSSYCVNSINVWSHSWIKNNWINSKNEPVKNIDLMKQLYSYFIQDFYHCELRLLKGHADNIGNELADALATKNKLKFMELLETHAIKMT